MQNVASDRVAMVNYSTRLLCVPHDSQKKTFQFCLSLVYNFPLRSVQKYLKIFKRIYKAKQQQDSKNQKSKNEKQNVARICCKNLLQTTLSKWQAECSEKLFIYFFFFHLNKCSNTYHIRNSFVLAFNSLLCWIVIRKGAIKSKRKSLIETDMKLDEYMISWKLFPKLGDFIKTTQSSRCHSLHVTFNM